jgi:hypothetical protein
MQQIYEQWKQTIGLQVEEERSIPILAAFQKKPRNLSREEIQLRK